LGQLVEINTNTTVRPGRAEGDNPRRYAEVSVMKQCVDPESTKAASWSAPMETSTLSGGRRPAVKRLRKAS
jgi:hypothetical protein